MVSAGAAAILTSVRVPVPGVEMLSMEDTLNEDRGREERRPRN